ncbi:hypothetical protein C1646_754724 [Rhizophagus diaphanus]|nr:hypothetical protein C1646_754724 [Rhizophagus diaphanus] [Rhizophagus sp. MUCL 43196]
MVHIWLRPLSQHNYSSQWNEFCYIKSDLFNHNIADSENEFKDIFGLSVDKLEDKYDDDEGQQEADKSRNNTHLNWMVLAEMGPNATFDTSSDLGLLIIDTVRIGKSHLINAIRGHLQEIAMNNGAETSPMIVLASTGIATLNIYGTTIHSTFSILVNSFDFNIEDEQLKNLQNKLNGVNHHEV